MNDDTKERAKSASADGPKVKKVLNSSSKTLNVTSFQDNVNVQISPSSTTKMQQSNEGPYQSRVKKRPRS